MRNLFRLGGWLVMVLGAPALSQEIVLHDLPAMQGEQLSLNRSISDLQLYGFDDRASSIEIISGEWELCPDPEFAGACITLGSDEVQLTSLDNQISAVRPVESGLAGARRGSITLFAGPNYTGDSVSLNQREADLRRLDFNNQARSIRFEGREPWRLCERTNFGGNCIIVSEDLPNLGRGLAARISSARPGSLAARDSRHPETGVWLFDRRDQSGERHEVTRNISSLSQQGFNNRAGSLTIAEGESWELCERSNYRGRCQVINRDTDLASINLNNEVSSLRQITTRASALSRISGGVPGTGSTYYPRPMMRDLALDHCLGPDRQTCGEVTANRICRQAGHARAVHFAVFSSERRTWWLSEDRACNGSRCEAIVDLLCVD